MKRSLRIQFAMVFITATLYTFCSVTNQELLEHKNILILGGTGYLGRALTTEILKYNPKNIFLFSRDEVKHFHCVKLFNNNPKIKNIIGDIRDYNALLQATRGMDIVIHAAALKRIDMLEMYVEESIKTNILGSLNVFNACVANKVDKVLFVSTDKACSPINTYGACKFISEKVFTHYDKQNISTKFMVARYGNVLESTGSVIPIFTALIKEGKDITLTDERMTRFIIHKEEAITLIFDALRYGTGGEIFVKRLPAFKITDLVATLQAAFQTNNKVTVVGIRPGEKIHELLINNSEMSRTFSFRDYFIVTPSIDKLFYAEGQEMPCYMTRGGRMHENMLYEYRSDQAVIDQHSLLTLIKDLKLI